MVTPETDIEQSSHVQEEMPFAIVQGSPVTEVPRDLYIPPDALEVFLEAFEGPLDLLLYLIKRQNLNILDIPIAHITQQYMSYIDLMSELQLELAAEYLVMAAMLAEIKSRMLLPRRVEAEEEEDPRAELVRRLQEYERYKKAAEDLDEVPRMERDIRSCVVEFPDRDDNLPKPTVTMDMLMMAFMDVLRRAELYSHHHVQREALSVRERMGIILDRINGETFTEFWKLFTLEEGRAGIVVSLLAILELLKAQLIELAQGEQDGLIHVRAISS